MNSYKSQKYSVQGHVIVNHVSNLTDWNYLDIRNVSVCSATQLSVTKCVFSVLLQYTATYWKTSSLLLAKLRFCASFACCREATY